jgi:hypothetical protein
VNSTGGLYTPENNVYTDVVASFLGTATLAFSSFVSGSAVSSTAIQA